MAFALSVSLLAWAGVTRHPNLLLPSLAAGCAALILARSGLAGLRVAALPILFLVIGGAVVTPLRDEAVWQLQLFTAEASAWWLNGLGQEITRNGVVLEDAPWRFTIVESCSGMRGIENLTLIALAVRELLARGRTRFWGLLLFAPLVGVALNLLRVLWVASSSSPDALGETEGHVVQGLVILGVGTVILYGAGIAIGGWPERARRTASALGRRGPTPAGFLAFALLGALLLAGVSLATTRSRPSPESRHIELPLAYRGWTGGVLIPDPHFVGPHPMTINVMAYRYVLEDSPGPPLVEVFVGVATPDRPTTTRLFSSKLLRPGTEWSLDERSEKRVLGVADEVDVTLVSRAGGTEHALVMRWTHNDRGLLRESLLSLVGLEDWSRPGPRTVFQLVTPVADLTAAARRRASARLDRFARDFAVPLGTALRRQ